MMLHRTLTSAAVILTLGVGTAAVAADDLDQAGQSAENAIEHTGQAIDNAADDLTSDTDRGRVQRDDRTGAGGDRSSQQTAEMPNDKTGKGQPDRTQITVDQAPAEAQVTQPAPDVTVIDPEPRVKVETKRPQVSINQPKPDVEVDQAKPQVDVEKAGRADVTIKETSPARQMKGDREQTGQMPGDQSRMDSDTDRAGAAMQTGQADQDRQMNGQQKNLQAATQDMRQDQQTGQAIAGRELIGKEVIGQNGDQVGEVSDVLVSQNGAQKVIIERGGFLGMGEKEVAVDMDKLSISPDGISLNMTDQQLSQLPDYDDDQPVAPDNIQARPVAPKGDRQ